MKYRFPLHKDKNDIKTFLFNFQNEMPYVTFYKGFRQCVRWTLFKNNQVSVSPCDLHTKRKHLGVGMKNCC